MAVKHNAPEVLRELNRLKFRMKRQGVILANRSAESVKRDIVVNINAGTKIDGGRRKRLRLSTVKAKRKPRRRNGVALPASKTPHTPLSDTGTMKNVLIQQATQAKPTATLRPPKSREDVKGFDVAAHHDEGDLGKWFGISKRATSRINRMAGEMLKRIAAGFNRGS